MKIRGTAHHIGEKYLQLARDAQVSGDPVMAESYLQHAEHYFRLIAAAQQAQQQGPGTYQRQPGGSPHRKRPRTTATFGGIPDRFASPAERFAPAAAASLALQPQPHSAQPRHGPTVPDYTDAGERQGVDQTSPSGTRPASGAAVSGPDFPGPRIPEPTGKILSGRGPIKTAMAAAVIGWPQSRPQPGPRDYRNETSIRVDQRDEAQNGGCWHRSGNGLAGLHHRSGSRAGRSS